MNESMYFLLQMGDFPASHVSFQVFFLVFLVPGFRTPTNP